MADDGSGGRAKYLKARPVVVGGGGAEGDTGPIVTATRGELRELVRSAVAEALAEERGAQKPALLDRDGLAAVLGCSSSLVDKLRRQGMPHVRLGDSPRFDVTAVLEWLRGQQKAGAA